jgi:hypothetical protein
MIWNALITLWEQLIHGIGQPLETWQHGCPMNIKRDNIFAISPKNLGIKYKSQLTFDI